MPTIQITDFKNSEALASTTLLNTQIREITTSSGHDMINRKQIFEINSINEDSNGILHLFYKLVIHVKDTAPSNLSISDITIEQFIEWYYIETTSGDELVRISGDEFSRITRRALGRFQEPDSRTDIVKRGIREITIMGRLPLPNNVYNLKKLLIAPNPGLFVKIKTHDLRIKMPPGRNFDKALVLLNNMESSKSSIVVYDQLVNEDAIDGNDYLYWPNLLKLKELEFEIPSGVKSDGLVFNLGSGNYPQSIWLSEYKDKVNNNQSTLTGKFSASINGEVFYKLEDIRDGALLNWYKTNDYEFIYYIGPVNLRTGSLAMVNFDKTKNGNSGNIVLNITKKADMTGNYKVIVIYSTN